MEDTPAPELRVDMISTDSASFNGEVLTHRIPAPAWAGRLVGLGYDPATIMDVYRNGTLETRISLGVAARFAPADEAPTTVDTPPRPPDDGSPTTEWSDRSPELALEVQAGVVAAGGASISDPALEPTPEPERVRAPLPPPADDPASPLPVVSGPLVHVELLYQAGTVVLDLPIDHVNPRLEACRQLVILGHADCIAKIDTQTFEPGFSYWADLIVDEGTTSFKRKNPTYWLKNHPRYHDAKSVRRRAILKAGGALGPEHDTEPLEQSSPPPHAGLKPGVWYPRFGRLPGVAEAAQPPETA